MARLETSLRASSPYIEVTEVAREQQAKGDALRSSWLRPFLVRSFAARLKQGTCLKHYQIEHLCSVPIFVSFSRRHSSACWLETRRNTLFCSATTFCILARQLMTPLEERYHKVCAAYKVITTSKMFQQGD